MTGREEVDMGRDGEKALQYTNPGLFLGWVGVFLAKLLVVSPAGPRRVAG